MVVASWMAEVEASTFAQPAAEMVEEVAST